MVLTEQSAALSSGSSGGVIRDWSVLPHELNNDQVTGRAWASDDFRFKVNFKVNRFFRVGYENRRTSENQRTGSVTHPIL